MKPLVFCTTFWDDDPAVAKAKKPELEDWLRRVRKHFYGTHPFLATGCQDKSELNPLWADHGVWQAESGEPKTKPYDVRRWSYFLCAFEAALWHAQLSAPRWDILIELESNCWINPAVKLAEILGEFMTRPELIMAPSWFGRPDFNFLVMKPAAVPAFLHHRRRGNLVDDDKPPPMLAEDEIEEIFRGKWWNPWPEVQIIRQQWGIPENPPHWIITPDEEALKWPVVALPSPAVQKAFFIMSKPPRFEIVYNGQDHVMIRDLGPWDEHLSVTNGAEQVVEALAPMLRGRRLLYLDSEGEQDELLVRDGKFAGFAPSP